MPKPIGKGEYMRRALADARRSRIFVLKNRGLDFDTFDALPQGTKEIHITDTAIRELPSLPSSLTKLVLTNTSVRELPPLPASLTTLRCLQNRNLTKLPVLPAGLQELVVIESPLERLPILPITLTKVDISLHPNEKRHSGYDRLIQQFQTTRDMSALREGIVSMDEKQGIYSTLQSSEGLDIVSRTRNIPEEVQANIGEYIGLPKGPTKKVQHQRLRDTFRAKGGRRKTRRRRRNAF